MKVDNLYNSISSIDEKYIIEADDKKHSNFIGIKTIVAAAAAILIASPFIVNAATNGEFFERVWGTLGREDIPTHTEVYYEEEKGTSYVITYPQQEFVDLDPEVAEAMIGDYVTNLNIVQEVDGTTITVLTVVRDSQAAIIEFTLEKEGGVDCLTYDQSYNESKGAYFADESTFWFHFGYGGKIYVDLDRSTDERLYCYCYNTLEGGLNLEINKLPCTWGERIYYTTIENFEEMERIENETQTTRITISSGNPVDSIEFTNNDGGSLQISPISISIDTLNGLGLTVQEAYDGPYSVVIAYNDGSVYIVDEHNRGEHTCEIEYANYSYSWGDFSYNMNYIFNRLVDTSDVAAIYINGIEYTRKTV